MGFDPGLEIGEIITNQKIADIFKVDKQQGIRTSAKYNYIVIVLNKEGKYTDQWIDEYRIHYTGAGLKGDQQLTGRNKTLYETLYNDKELFFFEKEGSDQYVYRGLCDLEDEPFVSEQVDQNGNKRKVYLFPLKLQNRRIQLENEEVHEQIEEEFHITFNHLNSKDINNSKKAAYKKKPTKKPQKTRVYNVNVYKRNKIISLNALKIANYQCEYKEDHPLFIRKSVDVNYTEPHHLVPMEFSDLFEYSLDVEENIVSLCSHCHNLIHYGKDRFILLEKLYNDRKQLLKQVGIEVTFDELKQMYK